MAKLDTPLNKPKATEIPDRILRKPEVRKITGVSDTTLWRMEKAGRFPKRISLGPNSAGWIKSEVDAWFRDLAENRGVA